MGNTSLYLARNYDGYRKSMEMRCQCSHSLSLLPVFPPPLEFLTLFFSFLILALSSKCPLPSLQAKSFRIWCHLPFEVLPMLFYKSYGPVHCDRCRNPQPRSPARKEYSQQVISSCQLLQGQPKL